MLFATGGNATLEVAVTGSKTLRFKWFKDGSEIPKATKNRLTLKEHLQPEMTAPTRSRSPMERAV